MLKIPLWLAALWWGSLTTIGFIVVPMLFVHLPTPALAGGMAARLFMLQTWLSVSCGLLVLLSLSRQSSASPESITGNRAVVTFTVLGVVLALLSHYVVSPEIAARENLRLWHSLGSAMFVFQWGCAATTFAKLLPTALKAQV
jgi:hypothetical protein